MKELSLIVNFNILNYIIEVAQNIQKIVQKNKISFVIFSKYINKPSF